MDAEPPGRHLDVGALRGRFVDLEPLRPEHTPELAEAAASDRSSYYWTTVPDGIEATHRYVDGLLAMAARGTAAPFVQRRSGHGEIVGATRFMEPYWPLGRPVPDEVEIGGTWLHPAAQRTTINTEAKLLLLSHAFDSWGVQRVAICTDHRNTASREAIERLGAHFEGILRRHRPSAVADEEDRLRDSALYAIIAPDWPVIRDRLRTRLDPRRPDPRGR